MKFNCIILAGGKSSRLNTDKVLIHYHGKSLLQRLVDNVSSVVDDVIIVSNDEKHQVKGATVIMEDAEKIGPLGGLKTGLQNSNSDWNLVLSVDMPLLNIQELISQLKPFLNEGFKAIVPEAKGQNQYLAGYYHKDFLVTIDKQLIKGEYALHQLLKNSNETKTVVSSLNFSNINTIEDIENMDCKLLKIASFGQVTEKLGSSSFFMLTSSKTLGELQNEIKEHYPSLVNITFRIAVNQTFEKESHVLTSGDELALLPPFAGG